MDFEWSEEKAHANFKKHGIFFARAETVWFDPKALEIPDVVHSVGEERWIRIGMSSVGIVLVVVYKEINEGSLCRIISARTATKNESQHYLRGYHER